MIWTSSGSEVEKPFTETAKKAYASVLANAGANFPVRDAVDTRVINEASGTVKPIGSGAYGSNKGIVDSQKSLGGWPVLKSASPPADADHDGMPDAWELKNKLNPNNAEDRNVLAKNDYTMLEEYLNGILE